MYLARKEFGKVARVFEIDWTPHLSGAWWIFIPTGADGSRSKLCSPGIAAIGNTPEVARDTLRANEDEAVLTLQEMMP